MNKDRMLALFWRWPVALIICCVLLWPVRDHAKIVVAAIAKAIIISRLILARGVIALLLACAVFFIIIKPKTWGGRLIRWLTAKDKIT